MAKIHVNLDPQLRKKYREEGFWGDATLLDHWKLSVLSFPEKTAVVDYQGAAYTFGELDRESDKLAAYLLGAGIEEGDVVSTQVPNWSEFTLIYIAALKIGAVFNPLLPGLRENELLHRLSKCKSTAFFIPGYYRKCDYVTMTRALQKELPFLKEVVVVDKDTVYEGSGYRHLHSILQETAPLEQYVKVNADDPAIVLFTSGTESRGKGVVLTHNNMCANRKGYIAMTQLCSVDSMLMPVPVGHATGLMYGVTVPFMMGMKSVLLEKFDVKKCLELIEREKCTAIEGPTVIAHDLFYQLEVDPSHDVSSLRYFYCGGSPVTRAVVDQGLEHNISVLGVYGSTESAPHCVVAPFHPLEKVLTTDGKAVPGMEIMVVDGNGNEVPPGVEGEEYSRGPNTFLGYLDEPEMTADAFDHGWYRSGDLCVMDADGYIRITGRKKDVIIRGGENISSVEVEGLLHRMENVKEAAVVAYPDARLGERACAYVTLREPAKPFTLEDVRVFMAQHQVAKFKWPERLEFIDAIPRNESGKVQKFVLRADIKRRMQISPQEDIFACRQQ